MGASCSLAVYIVREGLYMLRRQRAAPSPPDRVASRKPALRSHSPAHQEERIAREDCSRSTPARDLTTFRGTPSVLSKRPHRRSTPRLRCQSSEDVLPILQRHLTKTKIANIFMLSISIKHVPIRDESCGNGHTQHHDRPSQRKSV